MMVGSELGQEEVSSKNEPDRPTGSGRYVEFSQLKLTLRRWWWLLLCLPLISGSLAYLLAENNPTYYRARMLLSIGPPLKQVEAPAPVLITIRLTVSYRELIQKSREFHAMVAREAGLDDNGRQIAQNILVVIIRNTPFIEIQYVSSNGPQAIAILKTAGSLLVAQPLKLRELSLEAQQRFLKQRKQEILEQIKTKQVELDKIPAWPGGSNEVDSNNEVARNIRANLESLQNELSDISLLTGSNEINQLHIVEEPQLLPIEMGRQPVNAALALATVSLALSVLLIYLLSIMDSRLIDQRQAETLFNTRTVLKISKQAGEAEFELLTADLIASCSSDLNNSQVDNRIILTVYEQHAKAAELGTERLALALAHFGLAVSLNGEEVKPSTIYINENYIIENGRSKKRPSGSSFIESTVEAEANINSLAARRPNWSLWSQMWPAKPAPLARLVRQSDIILVFCSLGRSERRTLNNLANLLADNNARAYGIVLL